MDFMQNEYGDLYSLIERNAEASKYYDLLPDDVQEAVRRRADGVTSFASLFHYASNLSKNN
jgi:hypothetical protein